MFDEYDATEAEDRYERRAMEAENKKKRKVYEKAETRRLFTLFESAYDNDPRIQSEIIEAESAKQRVKDENLAKKKNAKMAKNSVAKAAADKVKLAEEAKLVAVQAEKDARQNKARAYKQGLKELATLLQETLPGTNYDRFWVEGNMMKIRTIERCQKLLDDLKTIGASDMNPKQKPFEFEQCFNEMMGIARKEQEIRVQEKEESKKNADCVDGDWTAEEVSLLAKGIARFPPGTNQRW